MKLTQRLGSVGRRSRAYFFLPNRWEEYDGLLRLLAEAGYVSLTLREFAERKNKKEALPDRRVFLRHDIDTDPGYVDYWLRSEKKFGFQASYYFRLRTLDLKAMRRIESAGGEASYHFEELASVIRRRAIRSNLLAKNFIPEARDEFEKNYRRLQELCDWPLRTVAAHGDFVNRKVGMTSSVIISDPELRSKLGILAEAYDDHVTRAFASRFSDMMGGKGWRSQQLGTLDEIIAGGAPFQLLTHPRHWRARIFANLREDVDRVLSAVANELGVPAGGFVDYANKRRQLTGRNL